MFEETGSRALAQMMRKGSDVIELLSFDHPQPRYQAERDIAGKLGFDLLAFNANSVDEVVGEGRDPRERRDPNGVKIVFALPGGVYK